MHSAEWAVDPRRLTSGAGVFGFTGLFGLIFCFCSKSNSYIWEKQAGPTGGNRPQRDELAADPLRRPSHTAPPLQRPSLTVPPRKTGQ